MEKDGDPPGGVKEEMLMGMWQEMGQYILVKPCQPPGMSYGPSNRWTPLGCSPSPLDSLLYHGLLLLGTWQVLVDPLPLL